MDEVFVFAVHSETNNTFVWKWEDSSERFEIYIEKSRVPEPRPKRILVHFTDAPMDTELLTDASRSLGSARVDSQLPIFTILDLRADTKDHFVFKPVGDRTTWEIRDLYIPQSLFGKLKGRRLQIEVGWTLAGESN